MSGKQRQPFLSIRRHNLHSNQTSSSCKQKSCYCNTIHFGEETTIDTSTVFPSPSSEASPSPVHSSAFTPTRKVTSNHIQRKVTWTHSFSNDEDEDISSLSLRLYPYNFSITGPAIPHRHQIDSPTTLCFHVFKLVCLVSTFTAILFIVHCLMYFLYSIIMEAITQKRGTEFPQHHLLSHPYDRNLSKFNTLKLSNNV